MTPLCCCLLLLPDVTGLRWTRLAAAVQHRVQEIQKKKTFSCADYGNINHHRLSSGESNSAAAPVFLVTDCHVAVCVCFLVTGMLTFSMIQNEMLSSVFNQSSLIHLSQNNA